MNKRKAELALRTVRQSLEDGRPQDAWASARQLLAGRANDVATLNLAGVAAFQAGEVKSALSILEKAAAKARKNPEVLMNLGNVLKETGNPAGALDAYIRAFDGSRDYAEPAYNAGVLEMSNNRYSEAAAWFSRALERNGDHIAAAVGYAEVLKLSGDLDGARAALEELCKKRPEDAVVHTNLAAVLSALGDDVDARLAGEKAVAFDPGLSEAHFNQGVAELALGHTDAALERFKFALGLNPENAAAALNMGEAHLLAGDQENAERSFRRALEIDPTFAKAAINLADLSLDAGDAETALQLIDRFLGRVPGQPSALAFKAIVLRDAGRRDEALAIDDPHEFLMLRDISAPDGYEDVPAFNQALADHVTHHPTLMPSPAMHATRLGKHTGELLQDPLGPMAAFHDLVLEGFFAFSECFHGHASHPFLDGRPKSTRLSVWGVVMDQDGHQVPHIHPAAWLSGVYYVEVPKSVCADDPNRAGWIEFGRPPDDIHASSEPDLRFVRPLPGKMILFPSHLYHRTVPLAGIERRISIAFDIMPADMKV